LKNTNKISIKVFGAFLSTVLLMSAYSSMSSVLAAEANIQKFTKQLFSAIAANNIASVRSSITAGANLTAVNEDGLTAASLAVEKGYFSIAHYILGVRNQKAATEKNNAITATTPSPITPKPSEEKALTLQNLSVPATIITPEAKSASPAQNAYKWPANKANPFSPNAQSRSLPIVGSLQEPAVRTVLPSEVITSDLKILPPGVAPLNTPRKPASRKIQAPTQILPLKEYMVGGSEPLLENKSVLDRMVNGVTRVFRSKSTPQNLNLKPETSPAKNSKAPAKAEEEDPEDGVIYRMWDNLTKIF